MEQRKYTNEFKVEAVRMCEVEDISVRQVAKELGSQRAPCTDGSQSIASNQMVQGSLWYSRMVVGWSMRDRITRELTISALDIAIGRWEIRPGLIHHSDRGSQYACHDYRDKLKNYGME